MNQPELKLKAILETCVYASDLAAAERFYVDVLGLEVFSREAGRHVFFRLREAMFLVFNPQRTATNVAEGTLAPAHGSSGAGHVAFRVAEEEIEGWRTRLQRTGVGIEAEVTWPRGGRSIYLRDPTGNSVELATPAVWGLERASE